MDGLESTDAKKSTSMSLRGTADGWVWARNSGIDVPQQRH